MRNSCLQIFALMSTFGFSSEVLSQAPVSLLKDSFEEGKAAPDGWSKGATIDGVKYLYDKRIAKSGERSLCLEKTAQRYFPIAQWSRELPHSGESATLKVSIQVRAQKATKAIVDVMFLDGNGKSISHKWACYIGSQEDGEPPATHDWKDYSAEVEVPPETKTLAIGLQIYGPGKVWFDDLDVTYVRPEPENEGEKKIESQPDAPDTAIQIEIGTGKGEYLYADAKTNDAPAAGKGLLVVLPGGSGNADFFPFIKRMHEQSVGDQFCLAQPVAKKWTDDQAIVWPTFANRSDAMEYSTEELVDQVVRDVAKRTKLDPNRIYVLAWSSGGPAAYAAMFQPESLVQGGVIAMSVFKPELLPETTNAKGRRFYLLHSPEDQVCPYALAEQAEQTLSQADIRVKLVSYDGGHGWHGDVYGNIRRGIQWLEQAP